MWLATLVSARKSAAGVRMSESVEPSLCRESDRSFEEDVGRHVLVNDHVEFFSLAGFMAFRSNASEATLRCHGERGNPNALLFFQTEREKQSGTE